MPSGWATPEVRARVVYTNPTPTSIGGAMRPRGPAAPLCEVLVQIGDHVGVMRVTGPPELSTGDDTVITTEVVLVFDPPLNLREVLLLAGMEEAG